jgi:hypothetical protein
LHEGMSSEASASNVVDRESVIGILWRSRHEVLRRRGVADLIGAIIIGLFVLDDYRRISHDERNSNMKSSPLLSTSKLTLSGLRLPCLTSPAPLALANM